MSAKSTLCILLRDKTAEVVFIDRSVLGARVRFIERLPRDEQVFEQIARLMKSLDKTPARVVLCPPRDIIMQRTLSYPAMAPADVANMIQYEATRHVPLAEDDRALGWSSVLLEEEKKIILNLMAARQADLQGWISRFIEFDVPIDEAVPFSAAMVPVLGTRPTLLVVTDDCHVELCLFGDGQLRDSQLLAVNAPGFSPERVVAAARQMVAKNKDWLGMEGVGRVVRTGPASLSESFDANLGAAFGLPVQALELPAAFQAMEEPLTDVLLAAATDLPPEINLIEHSGRKVPISKKTILVSALCALLAVELVAWTAFKTGAPALQRKQVAADIAKIKRRAAPIQRMKDKNREMRRQLYRLDEICSTHVSAMQVWQGLSELLPEDTYLQLAYFNNGMLHFRGYSEAPDRLPELLMASPFVEAISKSDIGKKEGDYHSITMTITTRTPDEETDI
jgi:hypothetical protein